MAETDASDEFRTVGADACSLDEYDAVELDDGDLIVYEVEAEEGWIQSSDWISLEFMT